MIYRVNTDSDFEEQLSEKVARIYELSASG